MRGTHTVWLRLSRPQQAGFVVMVSGYSHKLGVLLREVLGRVAGFNVRPERLEVVKEKAVKGWKNMAFQQPYQWAMYRRGEWMW